MTTTDRALLAAAVVSGLLLAQGPLRGGPDSAAPCGDACQQKFAYYDCLTKCGYEYEYSDCFMCSSGACMSPRPTADVCRDTGVPRRMRNLHLFVFPLCPCGKGGGPTRVEALGVSLTEFEEDPPNTYWNCQPKSTGTDTTDRSRG
jgi:hypothetical protein